MNQTRQKEEASNSFKSPHFNHNESPPYDSTSKRAHQVPMLRKKPEIERMLEEE